MFNWNLNWTEYLKFVPKGMDGLGVVGIVGLFLICIGLSLVGYRCNQVFCEASATQLKTVLQEERKTLDDQVIGLISQLTFSESNEEQRSKVEKLLERYDFLKDLSDSNSYSQNNGTYGYRNLLEAIDGMLRLPPDPGDREHALVMIREEKLMSKRKSYSPPELQHYAIGLSGLTYLIDEQDNTSSLASATSRLTAAVEELEKGGHKVPANLRSALGICGALRMRQRPVTASHIESAVKSHRSLVAAREDSQWRGLYMFNANHTEWCAEVYHVIEDARPELRKHLLADLKRYFFLGEDQKSLFPWDDQAESEFMITNTLFASGEEASRIALVIAKRENLPAIHLHTSILMAARLSAMKLGLSTLEQNSSGEDVFKRVSKEAAFQLHEAARKWTMTMSFDSVAKRIKLSECLQQWRNVSGELGRAYEDVTGQAGPDLPPMIRVKAK